MWMTKLSGIFYVLTVAITCLSVANCGDPTYGPGNSPMIGDWEGTCRQAYGSYGSYRETFEFSERTYIRRLELYASSNNCDDLSATIEETGSYLAQDNAAYPTYQATPQPLGTPAPAYNPNQYSMYGQKTITYYSSRVIAEADDSWAYQLNNIFGCQINWIEDSEVSAANTTCAGFYFAGPSTAYYPSTTQQPINSQYGNTTQDIAIFSGPNTMTLQPTGGAYGGFGTQTRNFTRDTSIL